ncbi:polysaccharide pyruvyl transferase family protein [Leptospira sp. WS58.C1]|uniref:polysaccharide pyruvyl transferase family protein n=1 Tax=Leptospira cinconiae TaxID=3235173 RepID=UPI00349E81C8
MKKAKPKQNRSRKNEFKNSNVLLIGTYSSENKGDAAMELSVANKIRNELGATVRISSPFPHIDRTFYSDFEVVFSQRRKLIRASIQLFLAFIYSLFPKLIQEKFSFLIQSDEGKAILDSDLIIDLSGDMLTEDYGPHVAYSHFIPILMSIFLGRKVFLCAQSIGPFKLTLFLARYIFSKVSLITVRESISYDYMRRFGFTDSKLTKTADVAFLLEPSSAEKVNEILRSEGLSLPKNRIILGVSVSDIVQRKYDARSDRNGRFENEFASMLDRLIETDQVFVVFISHVTGPSETKDDRNLSKRIFSKMKNKKSGFVLSGNHRPEEIKKIISLFDIFVGARMHANIGALSVGIPIIAISYSHKTPGIMREFGLEDWVHPIETLNIEQLQDSILAMYKKRKTISSQILKSNKRIKSISEENILKIKELLS